MLPRPYSCLISCAERTCLARPPAALLACSTALRLGSSTWSRSRAEPSSSPARSDIAIDAKLCAIFFGGSGHFRHRTIADYRWVSNETRCLAARPRGRAASLRYRRRLLSDDCIGNQQSMQDCCHDRRAQQAAHIWPSGAAELQHPQASSHSGPIQRTLCVPARLDC